MMIPDLDNSIDRAPRATTRSVFKPEVLQSLNRSLNLQRDSVRTSLNISLM